MRNWPTTVLMTAILAGTAGTATARLVDPMTLEELVQSSPLIVVGQIATTKGRKDPGIGGVRFRWNAELIVSETLKGVPPKPLAIIWEEVNMDGIPAYVPGTKLIWLLMKHKKTESYYAYRFDSVQPLKRREEIIRLIKRGAP